MFNKCSPVNHWRDIPNCSYQWLYFNNSHGCICLLLFPSKETMYTEEHARLVGKMHWNLFHEAFVHYEPSCKGSQFTINSYSRSYVQLFMFRVIHNCSGICNVRQTSELFPCNGTNASRKRRVSSRRKGYGASPLYTVTYLFVWMSLRNQLLLLLHNMLAIKSQTFNSRLPLQFNAYFDTYNLFLFTVATCIAVIIVLSAL